MVMTSGESLRHYSSGGRKTQGTLSLSLAPGRELSASYAQESSDQSGSDGVDRLDRRGCHSLLSGHEVRLRRRCEGHSLLWRQPGLQSSPAHTSRSALAAKVV